MKPYVKPTIEFVELRVEERLAACTTYRTPRAGKKQCSLNSGIS